MSLHGEVGFNFGNGQRKVFRAGRQCGQKTVSHSVVTYVKSKSSEERVGDPDRGGLFWSC